MMKKLGILLVLIGIFVPAVEFHFTKPGVVLLKDSRWYNRELVLRKSKIEIGDKKNFNSLVRGTRYKGRITVPFSYVVSGGIALAIAGGAIVAYYRK